MLDFLVLAVFAYLIHRIVRRAFSNIEQLFAKGTHPPTEAAPSQENIIAPPPELNPSPYVAPSTSKDKLAASRDSNKPLSSEKVGKASEAFSLSSER
jgi:hypothetical protein